MELFAGWADHPPTNLLVKAIVEGLGGGKPGAVSAGGSEGYGNIPPEAQAAMQRSALAAIQAKAGPTLPVVRGRDRGMPKAPPVFDLDQLRARNEAVAKKFKRVSDVRK